MYNYNYTLLPENPLHNKDHYSYSYSIQCLYVNQTWQDEKVLIKIYHYYYCYYYKFHNIINFNSANILICVR